MSRRKTVINESQLRSQKRKVESVKMSRGLCPRNHQQHPPSTTLLSRQNHHTCWQESEIPETIQYNTIQYNNGNITDCKTF